MKAKLEDLQIAGRGVVIESETEEEKQMLENIWNNHGGLAMLARNDDGTVTLVIAPTAEDN